MNEPTKFSNLTKDATYYEENLSTSTPFFTVADKSLFFYPTPTDDVTDGFIIYGISDPIDLVD